MLHRVECLRQVRCHCSGEKAVTLTFCTDTPEYRFHVNAERVIRGLKDTMLRIANRYPEDDPAELASEALSEAAIAANRRP